MNGRILYLRIVFELKMYVVFLIYDCYNKILFKLIFYNN